MKDSNIEMKNDLSRLYEDSVPKSVLDKMELAFNEIREMKDTEIKQERTIKKSWRRPLVAAATITILVGLSFCRPVVAAVKAIFNINDRGIERAVDNNYVQNNSSVVEDKNIKVSIDNLVIDNSKLAYGVSAEFKDKSMLKDGDKICFQGIIKNAEGKVIDNSLSDNQEVPNDYTTIIGSSQEDGSFNKEGDKYSAKTLLVSPEGMITKTSALKFEIKNIVVFKDNKVVNNIAGDWKLNVKIDDKFWDVKTVKYNVSKKVNDVEILKAEAGTTSLNIKFKVHGRIDENIAFSYIKDDKGHVYHIDRDLSEGYEDGYTIASTNYSITKFDNVNNLKLYINCDDTDKKTKKEIVVDLEREK
ncbi:DUF4179 domain-containing protein [Clostridium sp. 'White wine YQ']|uniref:DUF4179 domain-containing protein n=1 Tax=Clostridium sp. 'White wine YQ' TaxID=3027474 RepID=UPI0023660F62|nr:DUF4179 domain-containing protein [Clostridium sp. 'White wine YQ']MDD7796119.1 DUF4179 domain-containing protein [Clostridium sp. 'White wine YQ']